MKILFFTAICHFFGLISELGSTHSNDKLNSVWRKLAHEEVEYKAKQNISGIDPKNAEISERCLSIDF